MMNFSDCHIAKVKSFFGLKSIDPFIPFDEFLEINHDNLKTLLKKEQIIVIDAEGNEVDLLLFEKYISEFYENNNEKSLQLEKQINDFHHNLDQNIDLTLNEENSKLLEQLKKIETEVNDRTTHKERLVQSLKECEERDKKVLETGLDCINQKIEDLHIKRNSLLSRN